MSVTSRASLPSYSALKGAWHIDKIAALRDGKQIVPAQIQLVLSDLCNHDCSFCAYRMSGYESNQNFGEMTAKGFTNNPNRKIPTEKALEIVSDAARMGVLGMQFTGGGEPTVHPDHMAIFEQAIIAGLKCSLVSNGTRLKSNWREVLPYFSWVRISVDAGNESTYSAIRRVPPREYSKTLSNITRLAGAIDQLGTDCVLGTSFVVTRENFTECAEAARRVREAGAPSIRFAAIFTPEDADYYKGIRAAVDESLEAARDEERDGFAVINMVTPRIGDLSHGQPEHPFCGYQQFNVYIGGDLKVYRCCNLAYNDRGETGSLENQSLLEFWHSPEKFKAYDEFDATGCTRCAFHKQNEVLAYMTQGTPHHVEFV